LVATTSLSSSAINDLADRVGDAVRAHVLLKMPPDADEDRPLRWFLWSCSWFRSRL
jgi:hypothetical protein